MKFRPAFKIEIAHKNELQVSFQHTNLNKLDEDVRTNLLNTRIPKKMQGIAQIEPERIRLSVCQIAILEGDDNSVQGTWIGYAICGIEDQFNKSKGRKMALTQAMLGWEREETTEIWAAYWKWRGGIGK